MLKILLPLLFISTWSIAQVGIGTTTPNSSALLDVESNSKGFLPPRLTTDQRNDISSPTGGLLIYNTVSNCIQYYTGEGWFDPCCNNTVSSGVDGFSYLFRVDPSDISSILDGAGAEITNNGYIESVKNVSNITEELTLEHNGEATHNAANDTIFKYITEINPISYKQRAYIRRTKGISGSAAHLEYDYPSNYTGDFEITLVARFIDSTFANLNVRSSFFNSAETTSNTTTFQLGLGNEDSNTPVDANCNKNQYTVRYGSGNNEICGSTIADKVKVDEQFHVFNIKYSHSTTTMDFYIDNTLIETRNLGGTMTIEGLCLFTNRGRSQATAAEIAELFFISSHLSTEDSETLNGYLLCKYQD